MTEDIDPTANPKGTAPARRRSPPLLRILGNIVADIWAIFFGRADRWWAWGLISVGYLAISVAMIMDAVDPLPIIVNTTLFIMLTGVACFARRKWGILPQ